MSETWRPVPGWEDRYLVSDYGRVMAVPRPAGYGRRKPVVLRPHIDRYGYVQVALSRGANERRTRVNGKVHQLVALAFLGPRPDGQGVNHRNGDKTDNRPGNLEYVTPAGNSRHAAENGLMAHGQRSHWARLTPEAVREIRALRGTLSLVAIADRYGVRKGTISHIFAGTTWRRLT